MKKKLTLGFIAAALLLAILFAPIPTGVYKDGGTRSWTALTYRVVDWNRITTDDIYEATRVYWFPENFRDIDDLWAEEEPNVIHQFTATVLEIYDGSVLVEPVEGEPERYSSDQFTIGLAELEEIGAEVGSVVDVYYTGGVMESYPAQVHAVKWNISGNLRHQVYGEPWLDRENAQPYGGDGVTHVVITAIYADCFFARDVVPMPYEFKFNGQLPEEWCVGDQVACSYKNAVYDAESLRIEADLMTVEPSDFQREPNANDKPVIYLYPETETVVNVELALDGRLTCTYPAYQNGWRVTAAPDGTLTDGRGLTYNYLYWEGKTNARWDFSKGFCVRGEETAAFLEDALSKLGLNRREANEFIVYWLPLMEPNAWNVISFQTASYTEAARLNIDPAPDTLIRVFMAWQGVEDYVEMKPQQLTAPDRAGFTVVEWGGTEAAIP